MDYFPIAGAPLQVELGFVAVGTAPPPVRKPLGGPAATALRTLVEAQLEPTQAAALKAMLATPLDKIFDGIWRDQKSLVVGQVRQTVQDARPDAIDIDPDFPDKGTLRALTTENVSEELLELLSPVQQATQLTFSYQLPGVRVQWHETTGGPLSGAFDPAFELTFDAELGLYLGVPHDPRYPIAAAVEFLTLNVRLSGGNLIGGIGLAVTKLLGQIKDHPLVVPGEDVTSLPLDQLAGLAVQIDHLSGAFTKATSLGFNQLDVFIDSVVPEGEKVASNTVTFTLDRPFEPGPNVRQLGVDDGLFVSMTHLATLGTVVSPGGSLDVSGESFPVPSANNLAIEWDDTVAGKVVLSEIQWGFSPFGFTPDPAATVKIDRDGSYDGRNRFSTGPAVMPESQYAFRVRDYGVKDLIATDWSPWLLASTAVTNDVDLVLDDARATVVGHTTVREDGTIATRITVPPDQPPGTYAVWAVQDGRRLASAPERITVLAAAAPPAPAIQAFNHFTHAQLDANGVALTKSPLDVHGVNFTPGTVSLFLDNENGPRLGDFPVEAEGTFEATVRVPRGYTGRRPITALQDGGLRASTYPIEFENPPA